MAYIVMLTLLSKGNLFRTIDNPIEAPLEIKNLVYGFQNITPKELSNELPSLRTFSKPLIEFQVYK